MVAEHRPPQAIVLLPCLLGSDHVGRTTRRWQAHSISSWRGWRPRENMVINNCSVTNLTLCNVTSISKSTVFGADPMVPDGRQKATRQQPDRKTAARQQPDHWQTRPAQAIPKAFYDCGGPGVLHVSVRLQLRRRGCAMPRVETASQGPARTIETAVWVLWPLLLHHP